MVEEYFVFERFFIDKFDIVNYFNYENYKYCVCFRNKVGGFILLVKVVSRLLVFGRFFILNSVI